MSFAELENRTTLQIHCQLLTQRNPLLDMKVPRAKMPPKTSSKGQAPKSSVEQGLLNGHRNRRYGSSDDEDDDDIGLLLAKTPRQRSLARAGALTLLCLTAVVMMICVMTLRKGNMFAFNGRMKLVSVSVVFNHGAQASDARQTWETSKWVEGNGELTVGGMQQMYSLGQLLRDRYVDTLGFLPTQTSRNAIKVRSTEMDRNQESAFAVLLGLFDKNREALPKDVPQDCPCRPRAGEPDHRASSPMCVGECMGVWDGSVHRKIPPVEVEPLQDDWLLRQHLVCKGWQEGRNDTNLWEKTEKVFQPAIKDAEAFLGIPELCSFKSEDSEGPSTDKVCSSRLGLRELDSLYENLLASESAGKPCPLDVGLGCRPTLASLHPIREFLYNYDFGINDNKDQESDNVDNAALAGGMLLGDLLENMKRARKWHMPVDYQPRDESSRPPSMYLYSGDGHNIAALLGTMKSPWHHAPRYGSYVTIELWAPRSASDPANEDLWMVNILYDGQPLKTLSGCKRGYCRFRDFFYSMFWTQARYKEDCMMAEKQTTGEELKE